MQETDNFHVLRTPLSSKDFLDSQSASLRFLQQEHADWTRKLKDLKIDLMVAGQDPTDNIIAGYLGVSFLKFRDTFSNAV